ncbi:MAG: Flp family type IVb pilin [Pseudomonadota bacterium]
MTGLIVRFVKCEDGATAIEYALIAAGIAVAVTATVYNIGTIVLNDLFNNVANAVAN